MMAQLITSRKRACLPELLGQRDVLAFMYWFGSMARGQYRFVSGLRGRVGFSRVSQRFLEAFKITHRNVEFRFLEGFLGYRRTSST